MEDDKSTETVADQSHEDDGASLEDTDISFDDFEDTETDEETQDDTDDDTTESDDDETDTQDEETSESDEQETEVTKDEPSDEEKQKAFNKEMAERRIRDKQQREASIKDQQDEYLNSAEDTRDLAVRQLQIDAYNNRVESNTNKLTNSYERAIKDFDVLRDPTPEIQAEIDAALDAFQAMHVKLDPYGNPIELQGDLYTYLQSKADSIKQLTGIGARQQQTNKVKEKSKTMTMPSRAPKQAKTDPDLDGFDEEASRW